MDKAIELCKLFNCSLDNLFRDDVAACDEAYTNLRVETAPTFRYIKYAVISSDPESNAIDRVFSIARGCGVYNPRVIGWDFPHVSQEQSNVFNLSGSNSPQLCCVTNKEKLGLILRSSAAGSFIMHGQCL